MSEMSDGGPAFPIASDVIGHCGGMSLRDWFAGQAIAGTCRPTPDGWSLSPEDHAQWAYQMADAMLSAREGGAA